MSVTLSSRWSDAVIKTPRHRAFRALLIACAEMSEGDMQALVQQLPEDLRERLAQGPQGHRWDCGVCSAFGRAFYRADADPGDPRWQLFGYHEVPKLQMERNDEQHYGELANETYRRCLAIYRAAGWSGEASEPDA